MHIQRAGAYPQDMRLNSQQMHSDIELRRNLQACNEVVIANYGQIKTCGKNKISKSTLESGKMCYFVVIRKRYGVKSIKNEWLYR